MESTVISGDCVSCHPSPGVEVQGGASCLSAQFQDFLFVGFVSVSEYYLECLFYPGVYWLEVWVMVFIGFEVTVGYVA